MSGTISVAEREHLARKCAVEVAPRLRAAIDRCDADRITKITSSLDRQALLTLVVVLASEWPRKRSGQLVACWGCGEESRNAGKGLCGGCWQRYDAAPGELRPPMPPAESGRLGAVHRIDAKADRLSEYAHLAAFGIGDEEAAGRLGVSPTTIGRYRAALCAGPLQLRIPSEQRTAS